MTLYRYSFILLTSLVISACAISDKPSERNTLEVIFGSQEMPIEMRKKLNRLNSQLTALDEEVLLSYGDIQALSETVEQLKLPQKELDALNREIEDIEKRAMNLQERNQDNIARKEELEKQLEENEIKLEQATKEMQEIDKEMENTRTQLAAYKKHLLSMLQSSQSSLTN